MTNDKHSGGQTLELTDERASERSVHSRTFQVCHKDNKYNSTNDSDFVADCVATANRQRYRPFLFPLAHLAKARDNSSTAGECKVAIRTNEAPTPASVALMFDVLVFHYFNAIILRTFIVFRLQTSVP